MKSENEIEPGESFDSERSGVDVPRIVRLFVWWVFCGWWVCLAIALISAVLVFLGKASEVPWLADDLFYDFYPED